MISAHNLPKTRDERCVPQAWDEFESPCDFAQLPLTTADVASPMCEVCRRVAAALECLLWACNVREGPARPLDMSHTTPEVERLRLTLPGHPPSSSCLLKLAGYPPRSSCSAGAWGRARSGASWAGWRRLGSRRVSWLSPLGIAVDPLVITPQARDGTWLSPLRMI